MTRIAVFAIQSLVIGLAVAAWGNYRWHQGFGAGADTMLCVQAHYLDGIEAAMRTRACQAISGRRVPYFPERLRPQGPPAEIDRTRP